MLKFLKTPKNRRLRITIENLKLSVKTTILLSFFDIYSENHRCLYKKICNENPFEMISRSKPKQELTICSKEQIKGLLKFFKNPKSDPAQSMMIALSLFWGFGKAELIYSTFMVTDDAIEIHVFQSRLSYAHKQATRSAIFVVPKKPNWFLELQQRFIFDWKRRFSHLVWLSDKKPRFPSPNGMLNRTINSTVINEHIAVATIMATGKAIPTKVLKMTAGHLHVNGADASLLTQLGWARASTSRYTWVPRKYHT